MPTYYASLMKISGNISLPLCETVDDNYKFYNYYYTEYYRKAEDGCSKSCVITRYAGKYQNTITGYANKTYVPVSFWFSSNETEVHQEYLVYNTFEFVGSIGGTLGLFIGFSFHDVFKFAMNYVTKAMMNYFFK